MAQAQAPGRLDLVREFINTLDVENGTDAISTPDGLRSWLAERELAQRRDVIGREHVERARDLREALRELILANNEGGVPDPDAVSTLNRVGGVLQLTTRFDARGNASIEPASTGADAGLSRLLAIVHDAMTTGDWPRLKACRSDTCLWAFFDASKNRSRHWCSMDSCGAHAKARSYRERKKAAPAAG